MKTKELRQKTAAELEKIVQEKREKLGSLSFDLAGGKVKNVKEIRESRKDIAKILTLMKENEGKTVAAEAKKEAI
jgi:large subunit ribosomal protein L29